MLILRPRDICPSEITDEALFWNRRQFPGAAAGALAAAAVPPGFADSHLPAPGSREDELTPYADITSYNNFYEFGLDKDDPSRNAHTLRTRPWAVAVAGEVHKPRTIAVDDILRRYPSAERVYRLRCDEANLIITRHAAWATRRAQQRLAEEVVENIAAFFRGESRNRVV